MTKRFGVRAVGGGGLKGGGEGGPRAAKGKKQKLFVRGDPRGKNRNRGLGRGGISPKQRGEV